MEKDFTKRILDPSKFHLSPYIEYKLCHVPNNFREEEREESLAKKQNKTILAFIYNIKQYIHRSI